MNEEEKEDHTPPLLPKSFSYAVALDRLQLTCEALARDKYAEQVAKRLEAAKSDCYRALYAQYAEVCSDAERDKPSAPPITRLVDSDTLVDLDSGLL